MKLSRSIIIISLWALCYQDYVSAAGDGDLRLVEGTGFHDGRVEIYHDGQWGSICANSWSWPHAEVVCRQLGFTGGRGHRNALYGESSGPIWTSSLSCTGLELKLTSCTSSETEFWVPDGSCTHQQDAGVECDVPNEGSLRLVDGNAFSGKVEIFFNSSWFSICERGWSKPDAHVACRQLGLEPGDILDVSAVARNDTQMLLKDVGCSGNEKKLGECELPVVTDSDNCDADEVAGVTCTEPQEGDIRLANGDIHFGRVEVYHSGTFGTVCDDDWTAQHENDEAAQVVCRQLGLLGGTAHDGSYYGQGSGQIWLKQLQCHGNESSLNLCTGGDTYSSQINSCFHYEDASVTCQEPIEGAIRLSSGSSGRLEVYRHHTWGSFCSDGFSNVDSDVACRHLGYVGGTVMSPNDYTIAENDDVVLWASSVNCGGAEDSLLDCAIQWTDNYLGFSSSECTSGAYAAVVCSNSNQFTSEVQSSTTNCDNNDDCDEQMITATDDNTYENSSLSGDIESHSVNPQLSFVLERAPIRLMGSTPYTGIVELYVESKWTTICDSYWNDDDATVVCRQLGFNGGDAMGHLPAATENEPAVRGVGCDGDEAHLSECDLYSSHQCSGAAAVSCHEPSQDMAGAIRIVGGMFGSGYVEIFLSGRWGSICAGGHWDMNAARVVCRELGFISGSATAVEAVDIPDGATVYQIAEPILMSINCTGSESRLYECQEVSYVVDPESLPPTPLAGVQCSIPSEGDLRLMGGTGGMSGRVEIYHNNRWGTICSKGFDGQAALVACKQLGYVDGEGRYAAHFGSGAGPVHITHVSCLGTEDHLQECFLSYAEDDLSLHQCTHSNDVGIQCIDNYMDDKEDFNIVGVLVAFIVVLLFALFVVGICVYSKMKTYKKFNMQIGPNGEEEKKEIPPSYTMVETPREVTETLVEPFDPSSPMLTPRTLETLKVTPPPKTSTTNPPPPPTYRDLYPKRSNTVM